MLSDRVPQIFKREGGSQFFEKPQITDAIWDGALQHVVIKISAPEHIHWLG